MAITVKKTINTMAKTAPSTTEKAMAGAMKNSKSFGAAPSGIKPAKVMKKTK